MRKTFTSISNFGTKLSKIAALAMVICFGSLMKAEAQSTTPAPYCVATHSFTPNGCQFGYGFIFSKVEFAGWSKTSACPHNLGTYSYWNNMAPAVINPGQSYTLTMESGSIYGGINYGAWIDYNRDGDFADAGEYLGNIPQQFTSPYRVNVNVNVPCSANPGNTRMRVRMGYYNTFGAANSCNSAGTPYYGETWDFNVTITTPSNPTANFFVPDTVFTQGNSLFVNANQIGYKNYWSTSVAGLNNVIDSTNVNLRYSFPSAGNYQVKLTSVNCLGSASVTKNVTVVDPQSAPTVNFVASKNSIDYSGNPVDVQLFDLSNRGANQWNWWLNPGPEFVYPWFISVGSSGSQNPQVTFFDTGTYEVCLSAGNFFGWGDTVCKAAYVKVAYPVSQKVENRMCMDLNSTLDSGVIYDDAGPGANYSNGNNTCEFLIAPCGATKIDFKFFGNFTISWGDRVRIHDGDNQGAPVLADITGFNNTLPSQTYTGTSGKLLVVWQKDAFNNGEGFGAWWKATIGFTGPVMADFEAPDTVYACSAGTDVIFKNSSNAPKDANYEWIFEYDPNIDYCDPAPCYFDSDEESPTYTYLAAQNYKVRLKVSSCAGNDEIVKDIVVLNTSNNPTVDFDVTENIIPTGGITQIMNKSIAECDGGFEIIPSTGVSFVNGTDSMDQEPFVKFDLPGLYAIRRVSVNDNGQTVRTKTDIVRVVAYCQPSSILSNISDIGITRVVFNTLDNETAAGAGGSGYTSYVEDMSTEVILGASYQLTVERATNFNDMNRKIWIDFNRDGDFNDANELVGNETRTNTLSYTTTVTIPDCENVVTGPTIMRVGVSLDDNANTPCGPNQVGEYEDYRVILSRSTVPPSISLNGTNPVFIEKGTNYVDAGATANDDILGDITAEIETDNQVDATQSGIYAVVYNVTNASCLDAPTVTRFVHVVEDLTVPVISLNGMATMQHTVNTPFVDPMATAIDNPGNRDVTSLIVVNGNVDVTTIGSYVLTYSITDAFGNSAQVQRTVEVVDNVAPTFANIPNPYPVQVNSMFIDPMTSVDNYYPTVILTSSGNVDTRVRGQYVVEYTSEDASGNVATTTITYEVEDYVAPSISSVGSQVIIADVRDFSFVEPQVTATDNYWNAVSLTKTCTPAFDINTLGTYVCTYTAMDQSNNSSTYTRTIHVVDRVKPSVLALNTNIQRWNIFDPMEGVSVTDNYNNPVDFMTNSNGCKLEVVLSNVNTLEEGTYSVVYRATDASGNNSDLFYRTVTVKANTSGVEDLNLANAISVYPNPNNGKFVIAVKNSVSEQFSIRIMNAIGETVKVVSYSELVNGKVDLDLSNLASGVYFVQAQDGNGVATKKITITK